MRARETALYATAADLRLGPRVLESGSGSLLVTEHAGRVLGVFLDLVADNLLRVHPEVLAGGERARSFFESDEWNLGGDRLWLSPELELHFRDAEHPTPEAYDVPPEIDPGRYTVVQASEHAVQLEIGGELVNRRSGRPFRFHVRRTIGLCPAPCDTMEVSYIGYALSSELRIPEVDRPEAQYGLWQLLEVPPGGTICIPVQRPPELVDYFGTGIAGHVRTRPYAVEFPVTGTGRHKLGLRAADARGLMAYWKAQPDATATLIVRQCSVFPGEVYADYPAGQPQRRDVALQCYTGADDGGGFGELEYHTPAARAENFFLIRDESRTWCFGGSAERVSQIASELLGVPFPS